MITSNKKSNKNVKIIMIMIMILITITITIIIIQMIFPRHQEEMIVMMVNLVGKILKVKVLLGT